MPIIANSFIDAMNQSLRTGIPPAAVGAIAADDPLVFSGKSALTAKAVHPVPSPSACVGPQAIGNPSAAPVTP